MFAEVFQGKRLFRTDAFAEIMNNIKKHLEQLRSGPVRADVYAMRAITAMILGVERFLRDTRKRVSQDAVSTRTRRRPSPADPSLASTESWNRGPRLSDLDLQLCKSVKAALEQVRRFALLCLIASRRKKALPTS